MNIDQLRAIYQSDFKLWESASTVEEGSVITKTLDLPYGIGEVTLGFEGVKDAAGRRNAAGVWGQAVRDAIDNAVGEESVSARAAQKAARVSTDDGGYGGPSEPRQDDARQEEVPAEEAVPTLGGPSTLSTEPSNRLDELRDFRNQLAKRIKGLDLEIKALQAYVEVMNAQEIPDETEERCDSESEESSS
jgi:hypothetical protein